MERRRFKRFAAYVDTFYESLGTHPLKIKATLREISRDGVRLSTEDSLLKGSYVDMDIEIPGEDKNISAFCEVMWSRKKDGSYYDTGMRFKKIQSHDKARLLEYAYSEWLRTQKQNPANAS